MLKRLFVDNYKALVNCEMQLGPRTLLMGRNGTGKSTFADVLMRLQTFVWAQAKLEDIFGAYTLCAWQSSRQQAFEIDVDGPYGKYRYRLLIEHLVPSGPESLRARVVHESVTINGDPLLIFNDGVVRVYNENHAIQSEYPFDLGRSPIGSSASRADNPQLSWFARWFGSIVVVKPNVQQIESLVERDDFLLLYDAKNFASWYHALSTANRKHDHQFHSVLSDVLPGFEALNFEFAGQSRSYLRADFADGDKKLRFYFGELSEGQRMLILLYSAVHFLLADGRTVFFDEPDNYVSLDEIQPWLLAAADMVDDGKGQIILISHHPEIFDQWAIDQGIVASRQGCGPIRVHRFDAGAGRSVLPPSEMIARGWVEQ